MKQIPKTMKAAVLSAYDKIDIVEVPTPVPGKGEVLCRIKAVAICGSDPKMIHGFYSHVNWPPYFPFIMGHEWAGEVVALGEGVTEFAVGDRVAGEAHKGCGICENCKRGDYVVCLNYGRDGQDGKLDLGHRHYGFYWPGANAEYNAYKIGCIHKIPDNVSYDVASMCDTAGVAMRGVVQVGITPAGTTVVFGPGPIGLCAAQIAKGMGSAKVIVIGRGGKLELAKKLGADVVIDFEKEDVVKRMMEETNGVGADEVLECSGAKSSPILACNIVKKTGRIALVANYRPDRGVDPLPLNTIVFNELKLFGSKANPNVSKEVLQFFSNGTINGEALISHRFSLDDYAKAVDVFEHRIDGAIKVVIHP